MTERDRKLSYLSTSTPPRRDVSKAARPPVLEPPFSSPADDLEHRALRKFWAPAFFIYDWYTEDLEHAVDEALWPVSEVWN